VGYIESIRMVFRRSECSSYRCDGSFRKLCSATCICAFTTLPMVAALVPALCTLSATCLRFPRRCCFCVRSARCSRRVRVQNPEKKWGALGACHALNALNARIFFSRCSDLTHRSPKQHSSGHCVADRQRVFCGTCGTEEKLMLQKRHTTV
jgi:hypothetical protein